MLILDGKTDHPMKPPGDAVDNPRCAFAWCFACDHVEPVTFKDGRTGKAKVYQQRCEKRHYVECRGGRHIRLDQAVAALEQAGWRLVPVESGGGCRCPAHAGEG